MLPNLPVSPVATDRATWPTRVEAKRLPYGVPLALGELITRTFQVWSADVVRLVGISAVPYLLMIAVGAIGGVAVDITDVDFDRLLSLDDGLAPVAMLAVGGGLGFVVLVGALFVASQAGSYGCGSHPDQATRRT